MPVIQADLVRRVQHARQNRTLLLIDIAVPRDVEPSVGNLPNVFLYDIDALELLVRQNIGRREREIPKVEAIIRQEMDSFQRWYAGLEVTPLIRDLRDRFEAIRAREVDRYGHRFCGQDREQLDALTRGIVNKLLHDPTVNIRKFQSQGQEGFARLEGVRHLFDLDEEDRGDDAP
jgi:glutamyl-tRNA reductase